MDAIGLQQRFLELDIYFIFHFNAVNLTNILVKALWDWCQSVVPQLLALFSKFFQVFTLCFHLYGCKSIFLTISKDARQSDHLFSVYRPIRIVSSAVSASLPQMLLCFYELLLSFPRLHTRSISLSPTSIAYHFFCHILYTYIWSPVRLLCGQSNYIILQDLKPRYFYPITAKQFDLLWDAQSMSAFHIKYIYMPMCVFL